MYKLKIREYRKEKKFTQITLSQKIGISRNFLSELENNKYPINLELLCKIARELEVSAKDLFEEDFI